MIGQPRGAEAGLEVAQALAEGHLREGERQEMIPRQKLAASVRLVVAFGQTLKLPSAAPGLDPEKRRFCQRLYRRIWREPSATFKS
jgi:hypothetical protein